MQTEPVFHCRTWNAWLSNVSLKKKKKTKKEFWNSEKNGKYENELLTIIEKWFICFIMYHKATQGGS